MTHIKAFEILNYENYCALAISVYGPRLVAPEIAFNKMGINIIKDRKEKEKYCWTLYGPKLWREMEALREIGFKWGDIADYYSLSVGTALSAHNRGKNKWCKSVERRI